MKRSNLAGATFAVVVYLIGVFWSRHPTDPATVVVIGIGLAVIAYFMLALKDWLYAKCQK